MCTASSWPLLFLDVTFAQVHPFIDWWQFFRKIGTPKSLSFSFLLLLLLSRLLSCSHRLHIYHNKWQIEFVLRVDSFIPCVLSCVLTSYFFILFLFFYCCCYYSDRCLKSTFHLFLWSYLPWIGKWRRFAQADYEFFSLNHTPLAPPPPYTQGPPASFLVLSVYPEKAHDVHRRTAVWLWSANLLALSVSGSGKITGQPKTCCCPALPIGSPITSALFSWKNHLTATRRKEED